DNQLITPGLHVKSSGVALGNGEYICGMWQ
ncbi:hypothetical protein A2U01_0101258, partial [Trifolium medium]|nr:hypothetical protein [Trifolium medium]